MVSWLVFQRVNTFIMRPLVYKSYNITLYIERNLLSLQRKSHRAAILTGLAAFLFNSIFNQSREP